MLHRYRQRSGPYSLAEPSPLWGMLRRVLLLLAAALVLFFLVRSVFGMLGIGNRVERRQAVLTVENRSNVTVSLEGGLMQRADDRLPLYAGDRVVTGGNGHAQLAFFDGTSVRLDEQSEVEVDETYSGSTESAIGLSLNRGSVWMKTPLASAFSGTIVRTMSSDIYEAMLPSDAEVVFEERAILVFSADGDGVSVAVNGETVLIGEGQQMVFPETIEGDPRQYRSALDPFVVRSPFIEESRKIKLTPSTNGGTSSASATTDTLTVTAPVNGQSISGTTVLVHGTIGPRAEKVRVNGYPATISREQGTFSQELSVTAGSTFVIHVEALDQSDVIVQQIERTVRPAQSSVGSPTITLPAKNGETFRTNLEELEIKGTVPAGTTAVYVNDYKLQLFRTGDTDWSYLASVRLLNMKQGENIFNVVAENASGGRSAAAKITIILGAEGTAVSSASVSSVVSEESLPTNDPLRPGTLAVTAPTPGTTAVHTGTGFLLEGTTIAETASVWVNGYRLQLYEQGKTFWNYWALPKYDTLKRGRNVYRIVSRNAANQILDAMTYTVEYTPE